MRVAALLLTACAVSGLVVSSSNGVLDTTLVFGVCRLALPDGKWMTTRCYNGTVPGPHLRFSAGDTVRIRVVNALDAAGNTFNTKMNEFRYPNTTNLHTHGLHISPVSPSDEVRMAIEPGQSFQYVYHIPDDHAPGLHWYHPHFHGSSAAQVFGGGYGLLEVLHPEEGFPRTLPTAVLVAQYIPFDNRDQEGLSGTNIANISLTSGDRLLAQDLKAGRLPTKDVWLVGGVSMPTYTIDACASTRLRVVHASAGSELKMRLVHSDAERCPPCELSLLARDGEQLGLFPRPLKGPAYAPPGGRVDLLARCPVACNGYRLVTEMDGIGAGNPGEARVPHATPLAYFNVRTTKSCPPAVVPLSVKKQYTNRYTPDLLGEEVPEANKVQLSVIDGTGCRYKSVSPALGVIDDWFRMDSSVDTRHVMKLHQTYEISVNQTMLHPYHQHIQPFQIVRGTTYVAEGNYAVGDYCDSVMMGDLTMRFKPTRYTGVQMFHCHILSHEDQGCMAQFEIVDDAAKSGVPTHSMVHGFTHSSKTTALTVILTSAAVAALLCVYRVCVMDKPVYKVL